MPCVCVLTIPALTPCLFVQVEQILNLRTDLMEAAEKLRRSEAERQQLDTDITGLRQQVCGMRLCLAWTARMWA